MAASLFLAPFKTRMRVGLEIPRGSGMSTVLGVRKLAPRTDVLHAAVWTLLGDFISLTYLLLG